jgi:hypothetical protein
MRAKLLLKSREPLGDDRFVERVVWQLPAASAGSDHAFKYRLAFVVKGQCVIRYDNEVGKGDHRHLGKDETPYSFSSIEQLLADFWRDVDAWRDDE